MRAGTILLINLSNHAMERIPTDRYWKLLIGGRAINAKILFERVSPGVEPLSPGNMIIFGTGPLTGTLCPGSSRTTVAAKSPMTGFLGVSNMGGYWGAELKYAGYDHLGFVGKAEKPIYIDIFNDEVRIRDASHLWGKDTYETAAQIREELQNPDAQVICIGQAGENLVHYATIMTKVGDAAGRTGMGAVMGSKNLKAIAVRGTKGVPVANPTEYLLACEKAHNLLKSSSWYPTLSKLGSTADMDAYRDIGLSTAKNHQETSWEGTGNVSAVAFLKKNLRQRTGCFGCPVRCMEVYDLPGIGAGVVSCQPYLELTDKILLKDMNVWWKSVVFCQKYGLDPQSLSGMLAWMMEMYENGMITKEDCDGLAMEWGNGDTVLKMIEKITCREGIGDTLANNMRSAIEMIGKDSEAFAMHTKGSPHYNINYRYYRGRALACAVATRGDHIIANPFIESVVEMFSLPHGDEEQNKARLASYLEFVKEITGTEQAGKGLEYVGKHLLVKYNEIVGSTADLLGNCRWHTPWFDMPITPEIQAQMLSQGLGQTVTPEFLIEGVERMRTLERAFDAREGLTREDDRLPKRYFEVPIKGRFGEETLDSMEFESMKSQYYEIWGWDIDTGVPTETTLLKYGLDDVAQELREKGKLP